MLFSAIEGLTVLDEAREAAKLYPIVLEAVDTDLAVHFAYGLWEKAAGIAAAAGAQWEKAEEHYRMAMRQAQELPHKIEQPEVRRWYTRCSSTATAPATATRRANC